MPSVPALLDHRGRRSRLRPQAGLAGAARNFFPYDAANLFSAETDGWQPWVQSPDHEINIHRDRMVARSRDLRRNDGWASGGITSSWTRLSGITSGFRRSPTIARCRSTTASSTTSGRRNSSTPSKPSSAPSPKTRTTMRQHPADELCPAHAAGPGLQAGGRRGSDQARL
jgi:hypothetical protein